MSGDAKRSKALEAYRNHFIGQQTRMLERLDAGVPFPDATQADERSDMARIHQLIAPFTGDEAFLAELMEFQKELATSELSKRLMKHMEAYSAELRKSLPALGVKSKKRSKHSLPALRLTGTKKKSLNRLGGLPNLPEPLEWPRDGEGNAMVFLGQIDCAGLQCDLTLPDRGVLFFFWDCEAFWGDRILGKVLFAPAASDTERRPPPERGEMFEVGEIKYLAFKPFKSAEMDSLDGSIYAVEQSQPCHQMFGYPVPIQDNDHREECVQRFGGEIDDWRLLLQLDEDNRPVMIWGDAGRAYFWIRKQDLAAGDFSRAVMIIDCC